MKKIFKFFEQPQEFSGKMCLVIKLKTIKKQGFIISLKNKVLEKRQGGVLF